MIIKVVSFDPSMRAFGMASLLLDTATMKFEVCDLKLIETERMVTKQVRQNSDDLRRAQELAVEFKAFCKGAQIGFTEVPSGAQNARAAYSFGMMIGLLANAPISLIQVMPSETKLATVGTKTASKDEMIEHVTEAYPDAPWIRTKRKGVMELTKANEHLADAVAVAHAGVKTDQFKQLVTMWRGWSGEAFNDDEVAVKAVKRRGAFVS